MKIAVAGGTGQVGRQVVDALRNRRHEAVVLARETGIDLMSGAGLPKALAGADSVIDVTNTPTRDGEEAREFFGTVTANLLAAEQEAGVKHHVVLSIIGIDRVEGSGHYAGKRRQEEVAHAGPVPTTIVRSAQFHEFAAMVVGWTRRDDVARVPPLLVQPIAISDLAEALVAVATAEPRGETVEVAGPEPQDLVDMARRTLAVRGEDVRLIPTWRGIFGTEMAGEVLLPGPEAQLATTTFEDWLASDAATRGSNREQE